jgi:hypothetical protein
MEPIKRISAAEAKNYIELSIYDDRVCQKAIAFTLTNTEGIYPDSSYGTAWQEVTYYGDEFSTSDSSLSPLEFMYKEWNMNKDIDSSKDWGDVGDSNA